MSKQYKVVLPLVFCLILASTTIPAVAGKPQQIQRISYAMTGYVSDSLNMRQGDMTLSLTGSLTGSEDMEETSSGSDGGYQVNQEYIGQSDPWTDAEGTWMTVTIMEHAETWVSFFDSHTATWFSPQPRYTGHITIAWYGGLKNSSFQIELTLTRFQRELREGIRTGTATDTEVTVLLKWNDVLGMFAYFSETRGTPDVQPFSYEYVESLQNIEFTGSIRSRDRPPFQGTFSLQDRTLTREGSETRSIGAQGAFGPYRIFTYS